MWEQGFVLAILLGIITCLLVTKIKPSYVFAGAAFISFLAGMMDLTSIASNFTNSSLLTLVLLILASCALEKTLLISWVSRSISEGQLGSVIAKLGLSTALLSSFTNNTAVVVSLIGAIKRNQQHAPSKLLIPLSYAAILGGTLTLIGTSTNLIINSFVEDAGLPSLGFFTPTLIGLAVLAGGLLILIPLSYLLPNYDDQTQEDLPYFLESRVELGSPLVGRTVSENNLRALRKLFLAEVIRDGVTVSSVGPEFVLNAKDRLLFCGDVESVATLQEIPGLTLFGHQHLNGQNFREVVVSSSATFCHKTLKESRFRDRFDAVVVAIRRGHERLEGGLGSIKLAPGDTLVLVPGKRFESERRAHRKEFVLVHDLDSSARLDANKSSIVLLGFAAVIGCALLDLVPIIKGLAVYILSLLAFGIVQVSELRRRFPIDIAVIVGSALSIAQLMISSGLSVRMGEMFIQAFNGWGVFGALVATYIMTLVLTELVTNNAAAALSFPIGYSMAIGYGVDPMPFIMAVLFGASASFISPYGYQTNLLVYSVGNYKLTDYVRIGVPISIVYSVLVLTLIPVFFPF
ncbi:SLC13 family permease [Vibrio natriegens]|uniref:Potassium transporter TrkA n=1 Tax=Vibrio natriegens NBRC 15636 = ATCC 14048 = DSM 759 TaxID=1219067 RepID=A0AAN0Y0E4_VIBNA|nr:SLC13 family permease [Vibrio natriegens]ALR16618.1 potassium transporter TrkA [Vibrio natriegens NBRC 15636 = ATCC 14048 = DSM 759]ANQ11516.1 potassium transporter TrkA [Vibrio natriegens NBRC 15636 = ATCC 14048 = DSM 759]EPM39069.1 potassium transporter TrkA [Vibrio natriegens NBRC 15636 = ATCC 14048 = DSM 759]MDX6025849.1 SLC13 family permease [Vibrio natriegens NBRC 15636 = ATCC 14048 = DSM 759]UUI11965.1 SLC13 family permease [Vibrio natriegens]